MRRLPLALLLLAARVHAHSVPIAPSLCTFDPIAFATPDGSFATNAAPPTPADVFRIVYDAAASAAQLCAADPADPQNRCAAVTPERAFSGGVSGTVRIPAFTGRLLASGDLTATASFLFTVGAETATLTLPLTTGVVVAGASVVAGSPIAADGRLELVGSGTIDGLAAPLGGTPLVVRLACTAVPPPDLDQFVPATETTKVGGKLAASGVKLAVTFRAGSEAGVPNFGAPAALRIAAGDTTVASLVLAAGLQPRGKRKFVGSTAAGDGTVTLRRVRGTTYKMVVRTTAAVLPPAATPVEIAYELGGLLSRGARTFRAGRRGLHAP
jgi:hypothetical protein